MIKDTFLRKRYRYNLFFQSVCLGSVLLMIAMLAFFVITLTLQAYPALSLAFFTHTDSSSASQAGIVSALAGSLWILCTTAAFGLTFGIVSAIYLEEFSPKGPLMRFLELNINNLASVPPILFGVFGLFVFLAHLHLPRSCVLVGGLVLAMVILPSVIVVSRQVLAAVPLSIRYGALALGATHMQVVLHHVLPIALPRILTGCLVSLVRSFGETSPLLMVGMVAFIHDTPKSLFDPATTIPIQVYIWANNPREEFTQKGAAAVLVLLLFLICLNGVSFWLRARFEKTR